MIRLAEHVCPNLLEQEGLTLAQMGVFAVKQLAQQTIYGFAPGVFELWLQREDAGGRLCAGISRFAGVLTVCAVSDIAERELDELREFVCRIGGDRLEAQESLLCRLGIAGNGLLVFQSGQIMRVSPQTVPPSTPPQGLTACATRTLTPVYQLLCAADGHFAHNTRFDAWLADFSHRCRHGLSECYVLTDGEQVFSTLNIAFFNGHTAIVGGVATHPDHRGQGLARALLSHLCGVAAKRGLELWLLAADDSLSQFYQTCGWENAGRWASRSLAPV